MTFMMSVIWPSFNDGIEGEIDLASEEYISG